VSDATGATVKAIAYDAFGDVTSDSAPTFELPVGFAGGLSDPLTRLVHYGVRDYDPATGRWTAGDPLGFDGGQLNLYAYQQDNPLAAADPTGLDGEASGGTGSGGWTLKGLVKDALQWAQNKFEEKTHFDEVRKAEDSALELKQRLGAIDASQPRDETDLQKLQRETKKTGVCVSVGLDWADKLLGKLPFNGLVNTKAAKQILDVGMQQANDMQSHGGASGNEARMLDALGSGNQ
jgi:RHS repeat-associated protein